MGGSCTSTNSGALGGEGYSGSRYGHLRERGRERGREGGRKELAWVISQGALPGRITRRASRYSEPQVRFTLIQGSVRAAEGMSLGHHESVPQETESVLGLVPARGHHGPDGIYTRDKAPCLSLTSSLSNPSPLSPISLPTPRKPEIVQ